MPAIHICNNNTISNRGIGKARRTSKRNFLSLLSAVLFVCAADGQSPDWSPYEWDQDKLIKVDGEPFFPIGLWLLQTHVDDTLLKNASEAGFNTIVAESSRSLWNRAALHDLKVIGWLQNLYGPLNPDEIQQFEQDVSDWLEIFSDHPALIAWFLADEPVWRELSFERILQSYQTHRKLDPERPIWINYAPRNTVEVLSEWMQACDVTGADIYPVPEGGGHSEKDDKTISAVGKYTLKMRETVQDQKPVWMVLQGFAWGQYSGGESVYPTWEETRFMAYDAIIHGANGVFYWGMKLISDPSFWDSLYRIGGELGDLSHVLASETIDPSPVSVSDDRIVFIHKVHQGTNYIIAANTSKDTIDVELSIPFDSQELYVLFEGDRILSVDSGIINDTFGANEVHVYTEEDGLIAPSEPAPKYSYDSYGTGYLDSASIRGPDGPDWNPWIEIDDPANYAFHDQPWHLGASWNVGDAIGIGYAGRTHNQYSNILMRWDLSKGPEGESEALYEEVYSATLKMYVGHLLVDDEDWGAWGGDIKVRAVAAASGDWVPSEVTWNERKNGESWITPGGDVAADVIGSYDGYVTYGSDSGIWNINYLVEIPLQGSPDIGDGSLTALINSWADPDQSGNSGIILSILNHPDGGDHDIFFGSHNAPDSNMIAPVLTVEGALISDPSGHDATQQVYRGAGEARDTFLRGPDGTLEDWLLMPGDLWQDPANSACYQKFVDLGVNQFTVGSALGHKSNGLMRFDLSSHLAEEAETLYKDIDSAVLHLCVWQVFDQGGIGTPVTSPTNPFEGNLVVRPVLNGGGDWVVEEATWNHRKDGEPWAAGGGDVSEHIIGSYAYWSEGSGGSPGDGNIWRQGYHVEIELQGSPDIGDGSLTALINSWTDPDNPGFVIRFEGHTGPGVNLFFGNYRSPDSPSADLPWNPALQVTGTLISDPSITPAEIILSDLNHTYDGTAKSATITTDPAGLAYIVTYDGSTVEPVDAGSYAVLAAITEPGYEGSASGTLKIDAVTASGIPHSWLEEYDLPTDGSKDHEKIGDSPFTVYEEWIAGTNPNDITDILRMTEPPEKGPDGFIVRWRSVADRIYTIERSQNLTGEPRFAVLEVGIQGINGISEYLDETAEGPGLFCYRVLIEKK